MKEVKFIVNTELVVIPNSMRNGDKCSMKHSTTSLILPKDLDESMYFDEKGELLLPGAEVVLQSYIQGLTGLIAYGHEKEFWKEADQLRLIISELEHGFATPKDIVIGNNG